MAPSPALLACRAFLKTVWEGPAPTSEELIEVLEGLLVFTDSTASPQTDHWKYDPPEISWDVTYAAAGKRFPNFGLYAIANPQAPNEIAGTGDAIDDIADITQHVRDMIWYADTHNIDFAHDYFAVHQWHWTEHTQDLLMRLQRGTDWLTE